MSGGGGGQAQPSPEQKKVDDSIVKRNKENEREANIARNEYFQMKLKQMRSTGLPDFNTKAPTNDDFVDV